MFQGIVGSDQWSSVEKINKGWSSDEKYVVTKHDEKMLLRLSPLDAYEQKLKEFQIISKYVKTGIPMSLPLEVGKDVKAQQTYMLLTWVEGRDLKEVLPSLSDREQYRLGRSAGEILRKIHAIKVDDEDRPLQSKVKKILSRLQVYMDSDVRIDGDEIAIQYVKDYIHEIWQEDPVYLHGDFHPGNLIYSDDGSIGVIDFNRWEVGDPYEEFHKIESFGIEVSVPYSVGQIDAYFADAVPQRFWVTLAVYVAYNVLYSIKWAEKFGAEDVAGMKRRCKRAFENYDAFRRVIPKWYEKWHKDQRV